MTRWVKSRKLEILDYLKHGEETEASIMDKYDISAEELLEWQYNLERHGPGALRTTHIMRYRRRGK